MSTHWLKGRPQAQICTFRQRWPTPFYKSDRRPITNKQNFPNMEAISWRTKKIQALWKKVKPIDYSWGALKWVSRTSRISGTTPVYIPVVHICSEVFWTAKGTLHKSTWVDNGVPKGSKVCNFCSSKKTLC